MSKGSLEVVCGSMFSGKTEELMRRLRRAEYARKNVLTIKHHIDNRKSYTCITSHNNQKREAFSIGGSDATQLDKIVELCEDFVSDFSESFCSCCRPSGKVAAKFDIVFRLVI